MRPKGNNPHRFRLMMIQNEKGLAIKISRRIMLQKEREFCLCVCVWKRKLLTTIIIAAKTSASIIALPFLVGKGKRK